MMPRFSATVGESAACRVRINQAMVKTRESSPVSGRLPRRPVGSVDDLDRTPVRWHPTWVIGPQRRSRSSGLHGRSRFSARTTTIDRSGPHVLWSDEPRQRSRWPNRHPGAPERTIPNHVVPFHHLVPCWASHSMRRLRRRTAPPGPPDPIAGRTAAPASSSSTRAAGTSAPSADTPSAKLDPGSAVLATVTRAPSVVPADTPHIRAGVVASGGMRCRPRTDRHPLHVTTARPSIAIASRASWPSSRRASSRSTHARRAASAGHGFAARRRPDELDGQVGGRLPALRRVGLRRPLPLRRRPRLRRLLPRRHRARWRATARRRRSPPSSASCAAASPTCSRPRTPPGSARSSPAGSGCRSGSSP